MKISGIAADALGASLIGAPNFEIAQKLVREAVLVSDEAVRAAQRALWEELRVIAEPAGATGLAALMAGAYRPAPGERVATLMCGANTEPASGVNRAIASPPRGPNSRLGPTGLSTHGPHPAFVIAAVFFVFNQALRGRATHRLCCRSSPARDLKG